MTSITKQFYSFANRDAVQHAADALARGECVAMPTETVYGLAADATNGEAIARVFESKGRPQFNPLICHVRDMAMARRIARTNEITESLAAAFWPGPLTLVAPLLAETTIHPLVTAGLKTVALRVPQGPMRRVITVLDRPLAAPSANRSGRISPTTARHVADDFPDRDFMIFDGGSCRVGVESTIVRAEADRIVILRPGGIPEEALEAAAGVSVLSRKSDRIEAPGMMVSHYAPRAQLQLDSLTCPPAAALLAFGDSRGKDRSRAAIVLNLSENGDLREAAANLYNHLKALDSVSTSVIVVEPIPFDGLGAAINDRLARAAAPRDA